MGLYHCLLPLSAQATCSERQGTRRHDALVPDDKIGEVQEEFRGQGAEHSRGHIWLVMERQKLQRRVNPGFDDMPRLVNCLSSYVWCVRLGSEIVITYKQFESQEKEN
jgi:hypothetical protein